MLDDAARTVAARLTPARRRGPSLAPIDELARTNRQLQARIDELEAVNVGLRLQLRRGSDRLHELLSRLALAEQPSLREPMAAPARDSRCRLHGRSACEPCRSPAATCRLSPRERQVLRLLTEGSRSPCIAGQLGITPATVEVHRRNIMRKLGLHSVAALTKYAVREGLTSL